MKKWEELTEEEKKLRLYVLNNNLLIQQRMNVRSIADGWAGSSITDTTADGKQVFWIIGDSKTARSTAAGPTPTAGTVFQWNAATSTVDEVGASDIIGAVGGSPWPRFGIQYNSDTGNKPVIVYSGSSGSTFTNNAPNDWSTLGTLYAAGVTKVGNALAALGLSRPRRIYIILGINDIATGATSLSAIQTDIISLVSRLTALYPETDIVFSIPGRSSAAVNSARHVAVRSYIRQQAIDNSRVYIIYPELTFTYNAYYSDNLHWSTTGNDWIGRQFAYWESNSAYSKFARAYMSSIFTVLTSARKTKVQTFIDAEIANGNFTKYEFFMMFKNGLVDESIIDFSGLYAGINTSMTATANDYITSNANTDRINPGLIPGTTFYNISLNNVFVGAKIKTNVFGSGGNATIFGVTDGSGNAIRLAETTTPSIVYAVNDATLSVYTGETSFASNSFYAIRRNASGTKSLIKNGSIVDTASVASTATPTGANLELSLATHNNNGTLQQSLTGQYEYWVCATADLDFASFYTNAEALCTGW